MMDYGTTFLNVTSLVISLLIFKKETSRPIATNNGCLSVFVGTKTQSYPNLNEVFLVPKHNHSTGKELSRRTGENNQR